MALALPRDLTMVQGCLEGSFPTTVTIRHVTRPEDAYGTPREVETDGGTFPGRLKCLRADHEVQVAAQTQGKVAYELRYPLAIGTTAASPTYFTHNDRLVIDGRTYEVGPPADPAGLATERQVILWRKAD